MTEGTADDGWINPAASDPAQGPVIHNDPTLAGSHPRCRTDAHLRAADRWRHAVTLIRATRGLAGSFGTFEAFSVPDGAPGVPAVRHTYDVDSRTWRTSEEVVKYEAEPFARGALRECFRMKKLSKWIHNASWADASAYVAKRYIKVPPTREAALEMTKTDVALQMTAKRYAEMFSRRGPPKPVDFVLAFLLEVPSTGEIFAVERYIPGQYEKYNSNAGFAGGGGERVRATPNAFTHFTYEVSKGELMVVDIQGVGDLLSDPEIHTVRGDDLGEGNLGTRGMALFFHTHRCNDICRSMGLTPFELHPSEAQAIDAGASGEERPQLQQPATVVRGSAAAVPFAVGRHGPRLRRAASRRSISVVSGTSPSRRLVATAASARASNTATSAVPGESRDSPGAAIHAISPSSTATAAVGIGASSPAGSSTASLASSSAAASTETSPSVAVARGADHHVRLAIAGLEAGLKSAAAAGWPAAVSDALDDALVAARRALAEMSVIARESNDGNIDDGNIDDGNIDGGNIDGGNIDGGNIDGGNAGKEVGRCTGDDSLVDLDVSLGGGPETHVSIPDAIGGVPRDDGSVPTSPLPIAEVHLALARYHDRGTLPGHRGDPDTAAALFHFGRAAAHGSITAQLTLSNLFLGHETDDLSAVHADAGSDLGVHFARLAAAAGSRAAKIRVGDALADGGDRSAAARLWAEAAGAERAGADEICYEDSVASHELFARVAEVRVEEGEMDAAREALEAAAELAMAEMKGKLANRYYMRMSEI